MAQEVVKRDGSVVDVRHYTPTSGDIAAGQVVVFGTTGQTCGVANLAITNNTLGALDVGGGTYEGVNLNNAANGAKVWWDDSANKFTTTSTNNALFGFVVEDGGGGANTNCKAFHWPYV